MIGRLASCASARSGGCDQYETCYVTEAVAALTDNTLSCYYLTYSQARRGYFRGEIFFRLSAPFLYTSDTSLGVAFPATISLQCSSFTELVARIFWYQLCNERFKSFKLEDFAGFCITLISNCWIKLRNVVFVLHCYFKKYCCYKEIFSFNLHWIPIQSYCFSNQIRVDCNQTLLKLDSWEVKVARFIIYVAMRVAACYGRFTAGNNPIISIIKRNCAINIDLTIETCILQNVKISSVKPLFMRNGIPILYVPTYRIGIWLRNTFSQQEEEIRCLE